MARKKGLGRGLDELLSGSQVDDAFSAPAPGGIEQVALDEIEPNPFQPRDSVAESNLEELVASIREHGVLQPVILRRKDDGYKLIAGERRWRASRRAGLERVPAIVRDVTDDDALTLALVENVQRQDLNPVEKARAFREMADRFNLTQEEIATRTGKDRSTIANFMRLLELPDQVLELVSGGAISMGHARALAGMKSAKLQMRLCERIVRDDLSVRDTERMVAERRQARKSGGGGAGREQKTAHIRDLEDRIRDRLGLRVSLDEKGEKGKVTIYFSNNGEFQRLLDGLGIDLSS